MQYNKHSEIEGRHSFLSASKYQWLRYNEDKLIERFTTAMAAAKGTELHRIANDLIKNGLKLQQSNKTLNRFVNDAIGFDMESELGLYYSDNAFCTCDALKFLPATPRRPARLLVFDLKTGTTKSSFDQLIVYAAYFCLEYGFKPTELDYDLRIYQNDTVYAFEDDPTDDILHAMDRIVTFDQIIETLKEEARR